MMRASGRPLSFSLPAARARAIRLPHDPRPPRAGQRRRARDAGQVAAPRPIGVLLGLQGTLNPLAAELSGRTLPLAEQAAISPTPTSSDRILAEVDDAGGVRVPARPHVRARRPARLRARRRAQRSPRAPRGMDVHPPTSRTTCCSATGPALLYLPVLNYFDGNLDAVAEMLAHPHTRARPRRRRRPRRHDLRRQLPDHAAHPLGPRPHAGRAVRPAVARRHARAVAPRRRSACSTAASLAPGYKADVNVIDFDACTLAPPRDRRTTCPPAASACAGRRRLRRTRSCPASRPTPTASPPARCRAGSCAARSRLLTDVGPDASGSTRAARRSAPC